MSTDNSRLKLKLIQISSKNLAGNLRLTTISFKTSTGTDFKLVNTDSQKSTGNLKLANITSQRSTRPYKEAKIN